MHGWLSKNVVQKAGKQWSKLLAENNIRIELVMLQFPALKRSPGSAARRRCSESADNITGFETLWWMRQIGRALRI
jgi:hypothetical protein